MTQNFLPYMRSLSKLIATREDPKAIKEMHGIYYRWNYCLLDLMEADSHMDLLSWILHKINRMANNTKKEAE